MDNIVLYSPQGSQYNLGQWVRSDQPVDFGRQNLPAAQLSGNPAVEGAVLSYEEYGARRMTFPLRLNTIPLRTVDQLEAGIARAARPGAWLDVQPEGVASVNAIRFDVITGRVVQDGWSVPLQRTGLREVTVQLDVMPFGYLPTWVTLASAASVGAFGRLSFAGSVIGDAPGLARVAVQPSTPTGYPSGSWVTDAAAWSVAGQPSFNALVGAGQLITPIVGATLVTDGLQVASQRLDIALAANQAGWTTIAYYDVATQIEPAWRGRFRTFLLVRQAEPSSLPWRVTVDGVGGLQTGAAMASGMPVATIPWDAHPTGISPSPAMHLIDAGELTLPYGGSGIAQGQRIRVWAAPATTNLGAAAPLLSLGGVYLLPLDGPAGVMPRGMAQPTVRTPSVGRLILDSRARSALVAQLSTVAGGLGSDGAPLGNAFAHYQGDLPYVTASTIGLDLLLGQRSTASGATAPLAQTARAHAAVSVTYQPRFTFMRGV